MTVSTTDSVIEYVSGGPAFPIPYRFLQNSDIQAVLVKQDGTSETLTGAQYTLVGAGTQSGGTLTSLYAAGFLATPGAILTISRVMSAVQPTDLRNQGRFLAETHETVFDRLTMLVQQGFAILRRALLRPIGKNYYDAEGRQIKNLGDPTAAQDATTRSWVMTQVNSVRNDLTSLAYTLYNQAITYAEGLVAGVVGGYGWFLQSGTGAIARTFQGKMRDRVSVMDFLTPEQRENARLRLGTIDCGPALQAAINAAGHGELDWPGGHIFGCGQELIVRYGQKWTGGGRGMMLYPFSNKNVPNTRIVTTGNGNAYKTIKTRRNYRGSAADPQDAPLSAILNIQHQNFDMGEIGVHCWYDESTIASNPNNLGHDWDVGVFVGCRLHCKINMVAVTGCFRMASVYHDVTRGLGLPELIGWDGIRHPTDDQYGGDGCSMNELITWGGRWGVVVLGSLPKAGFISYGKDYKVNLTVTFSALPEINDTVTLGGRLFQFVAEPSSLGQVQRGATIAECVINLEAACVDVFESDEVATVFRTGLYLSSTDTLYCFARDANSNAFQNTFTASTVSGGRIVLSGATPSVIADPAPYYDQELGTAIADGRGSYGFSDFTIKDSQIFGSDHPSKYARVAIRPDKNWLLDDSAGSYWIDGLAGNAARKLQGHRYFNVRFDGSLDPFNVRLGRTFRDEFFGCHWDGTGTVGYKNPDGSDVSANWRDNKYGIVTNIPGITGRTRFYGRDATPMTQYFKYSKGTASIMDGLGRSILTGDTEIMYGNLRISSYESAAGSAELILNGGSAGSTVIRFKKAGAGATVASLRMNSSNNDFRLVGTGPLTMSGTSFTLSGSAGTSSVTAAGELVLSGAQESAGAVYFRLRMGAASMLRADDTTLISYTDFTANATNTRSLGRAGTVWSNLFVQNAPTVTSDATKKSPVRSLIEKELAAGSRLLREIGIYQWLESLEEKGADGARLHVGMTVQRACEVMNEEGLDPMRYGFICYDEWEDQYDVEAEYEVETGEQDQDGNQIKVKVPAKATLVKKAGCLYGFREGPLHGLMLRSLAAEMDGVLVRLAALEAK